MRTTLELDDNVYESARKLAFEQRKSLGKVISELASKGLGQSDAPPQKRRLGFWEGKGRIADDFNETPPDGTPLPYLPNSDQFIRIRSPD